MERLTAARCPARSLRDLAQRKLPQVDACIERGAGDACLAEHSDRLPVVRRSIPTRCLTTTRWPGRFRLLATGLRVAITQVGA